MKHAEDLICHGYQLIPINHKKKIPALPGWRTSTPLTAEECAAWPRVGVRMTAAQLVVDVDPRNGGTLSAVANICGGLGAYPIVCTPSGGWHVYMSLPELYGARLRHTMATLPGVEFKTEGRFVLAPGCAGYDWDIGSAELPAPAVPDSILQIILKTDELAAGGEEAVWSPGELAAALDNIDPADYRSHDAWFSLMCACHEATAGLGIGEFIRWSCSDPEYWGHEGRVAARWRSLKTGREGNAGMGTLLAALATHGLDVPESARSRAAASDFADVEMVDGSGSNGDTSLSPLAERPERAMMYLTRHFRVVDDAGRLRLYALRRNETLSRLQWVTYGRQDFIDVVKSQLHMPDVCIGQTTKGTPKFVPAGVAYLDHYRKNVTYSGVTFMPECAGDRTPDGALNLWRGFSVRENPSGSWAYMKELIWETLCSEDQESYDYVMNWLARAVQVPWEPGGVAMVFKGPKGTGKSTLGKTFARLFGSHGMHVSSKELLTGRFNIHLRDTVALFADEAFWAGDKNGEGVLKALVTERALTYEAKGKDPQSGRNCLHIIMASNEDWVVPAGMDSERRFAVFDVANGGQSRTYWDKLHEEMSNEKGGLGAMLYELMWRDVAGFDAFKVPQTAALAEQKMQTMGVVPAWLYDMAQREWGDFGVADEPGLYETSDVHSSYLRACDRHGVRGSRSNETALGIALKKWLPGLQKRRIKKPGSGGQRYFYLMPDAEKIVRHLERNLGM